MDLDNRDVWTSAFGVVPKGGLVASMQLSVEGEEDNEYEGRRGPISIWAASAQLLIGPRDTDEKLPYADLVDDIKEY
jgi:hypothetical protein